MMARLTLRAEHLAHIATSVRMMTTVKTQKAPVGGLHPFNTPVYGDHSFTLLSPTTITFTKYTE
jgi:hypothetical protein